MESVLAAANAHDMSMLGLFLRADPIVKGVMVILLLSSVVTWGIILDKSIRFLRLKRSVARFEAAVRGSDAWAGLAASSARSSRLTSAILDAGLTEWRDESGTESRAERRERVERAMRAAMAERLRGLETGLPFLATVGSAAPFVGLFGTVWGIMNSFTAIAGSHDTSLAVVAPGIAEALLATAIGLVAAIPAVVGYNKLSVDLGGIARRLTAAIGVIGNRMARERMIAPAQVGVR